MDKTGNLYHTLVRSPLLWGTLAAIAFFGLIHGSVIDDPLVLRYFTSHPVEYMETALFAVGLAALLLKILDVAGQWAALGQSPLGAASPGKALAGGICRAAWTAWRVCPSGGSKSITCGGSARRSNTSAHGVRPRPWTTN